MRKSLFIGLCSMLVLLVLSSEAQRSPNIILILADDLGSETLGSYGGESYSTPVLDQLAGEGVRYTQGYAYPLCTNTRASLITGKYNFRNWKAFGILDPREKTIGHMMKDQGYATCIAGKWQLQSYDPPEYPGADLRRDKGMKMEDSGFDTYRMWHTGHTEDKGSRYADPVIIENGKWLTDTHDKYGPDLFSDFINDFITSNQEKPFFVYYPMALPHDPFVPTPDSDEWEDPTLRLKSDKSFFKDMVEYTDKTVGKIISQLDQLGLRENTLIIFYSDNGTHQSISSIRDGKVVKGGKGLTIDDGTRVPLILNWPGRLAPAVNDEMVGPVDFVPTLFEVLGKQVPKEIFTDGISFWPNSKAEKPDRDWVYIDFEPRPGHGKDHFIQRRFVRGPKFKRYDDGTFYDIEKDRLEKSPLDPKSKKQKELYVRYGSILDSLTRYPSIGSLKPYDPQFSQFIDAHARVEVIEEGFEWTEGPVWVPEQQCLLFSDVPNNVIYKWTDMNGVELFLEKSGYTGIAEKTGGKGSNGLTLDPDGNLLLCRQGDREIAKLISSFHLPLPVFQTLAYDYDGKRFNSPNDLHAYQNGTIYFTDPAFGPPSDDKDRLDFKGVFRLNSDGTLDLLVKDLETPNGVALSPDGKTLYVANSRPAKLYSYDLSNQSLPLEGTLLYDFENMVDQSISKQRPDGIKVNKEGVIFLAGPDGIHLISPEGKLLGTIYTGKRTSNCAFNEDESILYATCDDTILRIVLRDRPKVKPPVR